MDKSIPKQLLDINGKALLTRTVEKFLHAEQFHSIVIVVPSEYKSSIKKLLHEQLQGKQEQKLLFANGGSTRQESVFAGLKAMPPEVNIVIVHDGARPMVKIETILKSLQGAAELGAVIAAVRVKDTLKKVNGEGKILKTINRSKLWHAQTPQAFRRNLIEEAYEKAHQDSFEGTDEASLLEYAGIKVRVIQGSEQNFKITRPDDLELARGLIMSQTNIKIGHGFDAHRLTEGRKLVLGGVLVPFKLGLMGHSDADVVTHALIDAILGAMGKGDIGRHFPDTDIRFKDINSLELLRHVIDISDENSLRLSNADITVVCQRPKLSPYLDEMEHNLASVCKVSSEQINIKATTTEKMGFTGREEGISSYAVVLLKNKPI